jgi:hypothetical protein
MSADDVLAAIDGSLQDYAVSADAMRWTPETPRSPDEAVRPYLTADGGPVRGHWAFTLRRPPDRPLWIRAEHLRCAAAAASDLGLPPRPGRWWRYLDSHHCLQGLREVEVFPAHGWSVHPASRAIDFTLDHIAAAGGRVCHVMTVTELP